MTRPTNARSPVVLRKHAPLLLGVLFVLVVLGCAAVAVLFWRGERLELRGNLRIVFTECFVKARPKAEYRIRLDQLSRCESETARYDAKIAEEIARCVAAEGRRVDTGYVLSPKSMSVCFGPGEW